MTIQIRPLTEADAQEFKRARLLALQTEPTAFASSYETALQLPDEFFLNRVLFEDNSFLFGAFHAQQMIGMAGGFTDAEVKRSHIGYLVSVWVHADYRGQQLAFQLCQRVVEQLRANPAISIIHLSVTAGNEAAMHIYNKLGFSQWGTEPQALQHENQLHDEIHMALEI